MTYNSRGAHSSTCQLKFVNFEFNENHSSHETEGLSEKHLVLRRGKPFKVTLHFRGRPWNPHTECLILEVWLGGLSETIPVQFSDEPSDPESWSAKIYPGDMHHHSVTIYICSPVQSSVAMYHLLLHIMTHQSRRSYRLGNFVLLCNPWLSDDPVYMPVDAQIEEYIKSDYGQVYMGTHVNMTSRPWSFGQYEPGVLEACLTLLQVSPQHLKDKNNDYILRSDPVYLSRVICAMVNCNDDLGILQGKWQGSYEGGVSPTEWSSSADILQQWVSSKCKPVRFGQCWVFASVLCTVMRVLGIPSRVVTVFNAAHDGNGNTIIEEYYSSTGEKLNISKDSIWNFHVWTECWMKRPDLGAGFDGWQVVDSTPQEKSAGIFCCGPCPVVAIQQRCLRVPYDAPFIYASVDADVIRMIVRKGLVVGRRVDSKCVGQLIYTKSINSDTPENLTQIYKMKKKRKPTTISRNSVMRGGRTTRGSYNDPRRLKMGSTMECSGNTDPQSPAAMCFRSAGPQSPEMLVFGNTGPQFPAAMCARSAGPQSPEMILCSQSGPLSPPDVGEEGGPSSSLDVSLKIEGMPSLGESIEVSVMVTNQSGSPRVLVEFLNAQLKDYNSNPQETFWKTHKEVRIQPGEVLKLTHKIPPSAYESVVTGDDIVNLAVVIKDVTTKERVLDMQEFNIKSPQINIEIEGGDSIQMKKEHTARVFFINKFTKSLTGAVLTVEGSGLLKGKHEARLSLMQPGEKIEKTVSIMANSHGTKLLKASFSHSNSSKVICRSFQKVSVKRA